MLVSRKVLPCNLFTEHGYGGLCTLYVQVAFFSGSLASMRPLAHVSLFLSRNDRVTSKANDGHLYKMICIWRETNCCDVCG